MCLPAQDTNLVTNNLLHVASFESGQFQGSLIRSVAHDSERFIRYRNDLQLDTRLSRSQVPTDCVFVLRGLEPLPVRAVGKLFLIL